MSNTRWLPSALSWFFTVLTGACVVCGLVIGFLIVSPSTFTSHAAMGLEPIPVQFRDGAITIKSDTGESFKVREMNATILVKGKDTGFVRLFARYGLPVVLLYMAFFAILFEMLRRLFRNVARGESFCDRNVTMVRAIGLSILVFSILSAFVEAWFQQAIIDYLHQHTTISGFGAAIGQAPEMFAQIGRRFELQFQWPEFLTGLLVLALSEVFRQGQVLKSENDLTV